jgi:hypothetical protein
MDSVKIIQEIDNFAKNTAINKKRLLDILEKQRSIEIEIL